MPRLEPHVSRVLLEGLEQAANRDGWPRVTLADLMAATGYKDPPIGVGETGPRETIPLAAFAALLAHAGKRIGEPCFGLRFAEAYPPFGTGTLGYIALNAPDLATMIQSIMRYAKLAIGTLQLDLEERAGKVSFTWELQPKPAFDQRLILEFLGALFVLRVRLLIGRNMQLDEVSFVFEPPDCLAAYNAVFGPNIRFSARRNRFLFPAAAMPTPAVTRDNRLFNMLRSIADLELERQAPLGGIASDLSSYIVEHLSIGDATLEAAAKAFALTPRQLQGDLKRLGTTFEGEVTRVRIELARRYLRDTDLPLTEIALMLGFSQLSAFTRAARSWFGAPPSEARMTLRKERQQQS